MAARRDKILKDAEKLVQKGKIELAIQEYEKVLKQNPTDANTINKVGDLYGRIGKVNRAIELYERIADHFTQDGFATKAIAILKKINRLAPQRFDIFDRLADLYI
jgi:tetratricopeptide (TPR) repeat protein